MNYLILYATLIMGSFGLAQENIEIFLVTISYEQGIPTLSQPQNISNNPGYDNQPSFVDPNTLMYAGTRNGATDIAAYNIPSGQSWWVNLPTPGGEFSPTMHPKEKLVTAVRLDSSGLQRLYDYPIPEGPSIQRIPDLKVAYFTYFDEQVIACSILSGDDLEFGIYDLRDKEFKRICTRAGRSIHKIPNSEAMSYTKVNNQGRHEVYSLAMNKLNSSTLLMELPESVQDYAWLNATQLLYGLGPKVYLFDTLTKSEPAEVTDFSVYFIDSITRIAIAPNGSSMAFAAETDAPTPEELVQQQLDAYNAHDFEAFMATYAQNIELFNFPNNSFTKGKEIMREQYRKQFDDTPDLHCKIQNRIIVGNKVIDEENLTMNGQNIMAVAIYEVANGKIVKVTFLR